MKTGQIKNVGVHNMNSNNRPTHYLEKHFPIKDRTDFFKWTIVTPQGLAKDYKNEVMYFDHFNLDHAKDVLRAIKKTSKHENKMKPIDKQQFFKLRDEIWDKMIEANIIPNTDAFFNDNWNSFDLLIGEVLNVDWET